MIKCVYPGSFDPFHVGHLDVLRRACALFDEVTVAVLRNTMKRCSFTFDERILQIERVIEAQGFSNAEASGFEGLLSDYVRETGFQCVARGVRSVMDYEYELSMAQLNRRLNPKCDTVLLPADAEHLAISSSMVREIGRLGGDISRFVPEVNCARIAERLLRDE